MRMRCKVLAVVSLLVFVPLATANGLSITGAHEFEDSIYGGEGIVSPIIVTWEGDQQVRVKLNNSIVAEKTNSEGINVSYSEPVLSLDSGESRMTKMFVNVSYWIKEDNFTINTTANFYNTTSKENSNSVNSTPNLDDGGSTTSSSSASIDISNTVPSNDLGNGSNVTDNSDENTSDSEQNITQNNSQVELSFDSEISLGESVNVTALVDGEPTEGVEIFLNSQLRGTTDEDGILTFTPGEEGTLSVAAAYNNSFNSSSLEVTEEAAESNGITGAVVESAPAYGFVSLMVAVIGLIYWRREDIVSSLKGNLDYIRS